MRKSDFVWPLEYALDRDVSSLALMLPICVVAMALRSNHCFNHGMTEHSETFNSLWAYCSENERAIPQDWKRLYDMLADKRRSPSGGWEPPLPLILAAWDCTMPIEKQLRFKEHIQWACEHGQANQIGNWLRSLREDEWFHFGEL